jgi:hypothetical protein
LWLCWTERVVASASKGDGLLLLGGISWPALSPSSPLQALPSRLYL